MKSGVNYTKNTLTVIAWGVVPLIAILFYLQLNFSHLDEKFQSMKLVISRSTQMSIPIVYLAKDSNFEVDLEAPLFFTQDNDSIYLVDFGDEITLRQFRLYFNDSSETLNIKHIYLSSDERQHELNLKEFKAHNIKIIKKESDLLSIRIAPSKNYNYLESTRFYYSFDYGSILFAYLLSSLAFWMFPFLIKSTNLILWVKNLKVEEISIMIFVLAIFLPQRIYNLALAISFILVIRNFCFKTFFDSKINILFILTGVVVLLNFLFINSDYNFKAIEKYALFFAMPVYASCLRTNKILDLFCISSFLIGLGLVVSASVDIFIFRKLEIVSFDNFTRSIHPVYYSYLLAFSIMYLELKVSVKDKIFLQAILMSLLILSGSKLIISLTIIWLLFFVGKRIAVFAIPILIAALVLFSPVRERFLSISNLNDLSIVGEKFVSDPKDARLNGLTLRLILWQESLVINDLSDFLFGKGVSLKASKQFENRLLMRGLVNHAEFNSHNQYVTTMQKTGLVGLLILLSTIFFCFHHGRVAGNFLLIYFTAMMGIAMLSESLFERSSGTTFFILITLAMVNFNDKKTDLKGRSV